MSIRRKSNLETKTVAVFKISFFESTDYKNSRNITSPPSGAKSLLFCFNKTILIQGNLYSTCVSVL